jgi:hypothetical protein
VPLVGIDRDAKRNGNLARRAGGDGHVDGQSTEERANSPGAVGIDEIREGVVDAGAFVLDRRFR